MKTLRRDDAFKTFESILYSGGATVSLAGMQAQLMTPGDPRQGDVWIVGGLVSLGKVASADVTADWVEDMVTAAQRVPGHSLWAGVGFWMDPETGEVEAELVETTSLRPMAEQWMQERGEKAIYELNSGHTVFANGVEVMPLA